MPLNLAPEVENAVRERAAAEGVTESDYLARLLNVSIPTTAANINTTAPSINATEALFRQWDKEDANMTDEEREEEEQLWEKLMEGIDEFRRIAGMRLLFENGYSRKQESVKEG